MNATYAGVPIPALANLDADTHRRLLHRLEADCTAAAVRNQAILRARRARQQETALDAIPAEPARVAALHRRRLTEATRPRRTA